MYHNVFWFRRDLRLSDNTGLFHALNSGLPVIPVFIFDKQLLDKLSDSSDARVTFIYDTIRRLKIELQTVGSDLIVRYGDPVDVWKSLTKEYNLQMVFANHDFESVSYTHLTLPTSDLV